MTTKKCSICGYNIKFDEPLTSQDYESMLFNDRWVCGECIRKGKFDIENDEWQQLQESRKKELKAISEVI